VTQFHDSKAANEADQHFARVFQKGETPDDVIPIGRDGMLTDELTKAGLTKSRAEAKRLLAQGAIEIDGNKIMEDLNVLKITSGSIIKVGKRRFAST
jgi:tyrosyl-tRNA synthetase